MDDKERGETYLQLEATVKELNEQLRKVAKISNGLSMLNFFLTEKVGKEKLDPGAYPSIKDLVNLDAIERITDRILELRLRKQDLEKMLGITLTIEKPE